MTADTLAPWDGVPMNPERDGWHWLGYWSADRTIFCKLWEGGLWIDTAGHPKAGASLVCIIYRYLGPCPTPQEVATIRAEAHAAGWLAAREAAAGAAKSCGSPVGAGDGWGTYIPGTSTDAARSIRALATPPEVADVLARVREEAKVEEREAIALWFDGRAINAERNWQHQHDRWGHGERFVASMRDCAAAIRARGGKP